jgi:predicted small secreted protein
MKRRFFTVFSGIALSSFILSSCDTPTGAGAGYGAAAGAIIGGAATGNVRAAAIGAAAGAATGALIGHAIQEDRVRAYGPVPPGGWPLARYTNTPGVFRSPYTGRHYDLRGVPPGGLTRDIDTGQLFRRPYGGYY